MNIVDNLYKTECEIKVKLASANEQIRMIRKVLECGFSEDPPYIETDYTTDTYNHACKNNDIILRFRTRAQLPEAEKFINNTKNDYRITLKIKEASKTAQVNREIECTTEEIPCDKYAEINQKLLSYTGASLEKIDFNVNWENLICQLANTGFEVCRMLSQKVRQEFHRNDCTICFDYFPHQVGYYVEIETFHEDLLESIADELGLEIKCREIDSYGEIIQRTLKAQETGLSQTRICVFDENLENLMRKVSNHEIQRG